MRISYLTAIGIISLAFSSQANACWRSGPNFYLGHDVSRTWTMKPGEVCSHSTVLRDGGAVIHEIRIVQKATHGTVGTNGASNYAYRAPPNYVGKDHFAVRLFGERHGQKASTQINVEVDIKR